MAAVSTSQIENLLNKYGKTLKEGKRYENHALTIALDYLAEMTEGKIQPYMEESLVSLLGDVCEDK